MRIGQLVRHVYRKFHGIPAVAEKQLTPLEEKIYNDGERLIPGVTHDLMEVIRHKSSYDFFRMVIEADLTGREAVHIVDLGCGVGHGCQILSTLKNSNIVGTDFSPESLQYAQHHYAADNITYELVDLGMYIREMPEYGYVVSRGVFEHIPNGIDVAMSANWRHRLLFDVPYDEPDEANPHHLVWGIREEHFEKFPDAELFFQDLSGVIYDVANKPEKPNMIICICSHPDLPKVGSGRINFPLPAWQPQKRPD